MAKKAEPIRSEIRTSVIEATGSSGIVSRNVGCMITTGTASCINGSPVKYLRVAQSGRPEYHTEDGKVWRGAQ